MVSRDTAAGYGRDRHNRHVDRFHLLTDRALAEGTRQVEPPRNRDEGDGNVVVPQLDARLLPREA
jgi:hypothetical protein